MREQKTGGGFQILGTEERGKRARGEEERKGQVGEREKQAKIGAGCERGQDRSGIDKGLDGMEDGGREQTDEGERGVSGPLSGLTIHQQRTGLRLSCVSNSTHLPIPDSYIQNRDSCPVGTNQT
eukprot:3151169-Rhodomonas_salina.2